MGAPNVAPLAIRQRGGAARFVAAWRNFQPEENPMSRAVRIDKHGGAEEMKIVDVTVGEQYMHA